MFIFIYFNILYTFYLYSNNKNNYVYIKGYILKNISNIVVDFFKRISSF